MKGAGRMEVEKVVLRNGVYAREAVVIKLNLLLVHMRFRRSQEKTRPQREKAPHASYGMRIE